MTPRTVTLHGGPGDGASVTIHAGQVEHITWYGIHRYDAATGAYLGTDDGTDPELVPA